MQVQFQVLRSIGASGSISRSLIGKRLGCVFLAISSFLDKACDYDKLMLQLEGWKLIVLCLLLLQCMVGISIWSTYRMLLLILSLIVLSTCASLRGMSKLARCASFAVLLMG